jgi:hypothetical protein
MDYATANTPRVTKSLNPPREHKVVREKLNEERREDEKKIRDPLFIDLFLGSLKRQRSFVDFDLKLVVNTFTYKNAAGYCFHLALVTFENDPQDPWN